MSTEVKPTDWDAEDNRWEPTPSGGGSGLPPYTSADKGKVLTIGEGESTETVIVPAQDIQLTEYDGAAVGQVENADVEAFSNLQEGDSVVFVANGSALPSTTTSIHRTEDEFGYVTIDVASIVIGQGIYVLSYVVGEESISFSYHVAKGGSGILPTHMSLSLSASVPSVEPKWEGVGGYIHNASRAFESGVMGLLQTAVTTLVQNNKTFAEAYGIILADDDSAAVLAMAQNPTRVNVWHALNQDFVVLRSNDNGNDNGSITVMLPYYEQVVATTLTYFLSITFTMNSSKSCYVRVFVLGTMGTSN